MPVSAAMLTDPRAVKKHLGNGISQNSHSLPDFLLAAPCQSSKTLFPFAGPSYDFNVVSLKDDAYHFFDGEGIGKNTTNAIGASQSSSSHFDPRKLLDPKGCNPTQLKKDSNNTTESDSRNGVQKRSLEEGEGQGMGNLIERIHNVTHREDRPRKRQKFEQIRGEDDDQKKTSFAGGGKGGEIGEYMKQKRKEGQSGVGPNSVVDLTGGRHSLIHYCEAFKLIYLLADDGDVVIAKAEDKEVCYGRLDSTKVQAHAIPNPGMKATYLSKSDWPTMKLRLQRLPGKGQIIRVFDPTDKDFGNVDLRTAQGLTRIMDSKSTKFRTQARLNIRNRKPDEIPGDCCSEYLEMTLNLYGPRSKAALIGKFLAQKQLYLRAPWFVDVGIETCNPHAPSTGVLPRTAPPSASATKGSGAGYVSRTVEEIRSDVLGMFDSLEKSENLPEMMPSPLITTNLLAHQKQGLRFMTNKEKERVFSDKEEDNSSLWRVKYRTNGQQIYYNVITGQEELTKPPEVLGGILADMMGLGKTLSILSLIVGGLDDSVEWAKQLPSESDVDGVQSQLVRNSKATLLVSPLSTVANWEEQISTHVKKDSLKYYVFHGGNRIQDVHELANYDLIITTYSIVSSEVYGRGKKKDISPLLETNFFRIVLDEAHMIREQSTRQSQAICALSAQRRWAVTGTPVQNRLDDLGALIKFLRVKPFSDRGGFSQFILCPFKSADPEILPKLRLLVDSITLRRLKDRIDLPARHDRIVRLPFSDDESVLYEWFARDSDRRMKIIAVESKKGLGGKTYVHILRAIMRLRLICAHGRELLSEQDLKMTEGFSLNNAIDLEDEENDAPAINSRQAYEMLMLLKETDADSCAQCARTIGHSDPEIVVNHEILGYMLPCFQIVCRDCMHDLKSSPEQRLVNDHFTCPFCDQYLRTSFFELTQSGIEAAEEAKNRARENPKQAKIMGRYSGPHTKTRALIEDLKNSAIESQDFPKNKPVKSVVFSGWTAHLDLIQIALEDNRINYVRLDGRMSRSKRTAALDAFRDDPNVTVFLISITAGGLGLNLTTASKVYVMEPQFNPAAEAQAVDRVHRLGQTRDVFITRFIMEHSFEEKMLDLQRKKENLADLSMNRGKLDKAEAARFKLEELRSLFR